jgi:hypothetical protein
MKDTYLGLTYNNYGKKYGVISTHLSGPEILDDSNLVSNSLIISSPTNGDFDGNLSDARDNNSSHAMFFTDHKGNAVRLTYTILPGNGLVVNAYQNNSGNTIYTSHPYSYDTLTFEIDKDSLKTITTNGQLQVSKPDIIDNYTLMVTQELNSIHTYISVVTANLEKATDIRYGIVRGDNMTISANNGILNVNTQNLDYIDDNTNTAGIVRPNPDLPEGEYDWRTIEANNGVLRVLTYNLDRATQNVVGVVKPEGVTTLTDIDGTISVRTAGLEKASYENGIMTYGIVRPDNYTIETTAPGVLYANAEHMTPTRIENGDSYFGVIKLDPISLGIDTANNTYVNRYPEIVALLDRYLGDYTYIMNWLIDHENRITALEHQNVEMIASFNNYGTSITELDVPVWDPVAQVVHSEERYYSVQFSIVTNCKFHVSVEYQNNVAPGITLHTVKMGDNPPVSGSGLSNYMFESTNMNESTLNFEFLCNNYTSLTNEGNTPTTVFIMVSSINDASVYKTGAHVFNRWNMQWFIQPSQPEPVITYETRVSYDIVQNGAQNKDLYFMVFNGSEYIPYKDGNNQHITEISYIQPMSSTMTMSSYSFYIVAEENMKYVKTVYTDKYVDGVLVPEATTIEVTDGDTFTNYLPLTLSTNSRTAYTLIVEEPSLYYRNAMVDGNENGWLESSDETQMWLSYYMRNTATNTATIENRVGHNILDVMSIYPVSMNDRKATMTLDIHHATGNYESWKNTQLTINYIEDIRENNINVFVQSIIPQYITRNTAVSSISLLDLHITRSDNVTLNEKWVVNIQHCFSTIHGLLRNSSNIETPDIETPSQEVINWSKTRTNTNYDEVDETTRINIMNQDNIFNKINVELDPETTNAIISVKLDINSGNAYIENPQNAVIKNSDGTSANINNLVPASVIDYILNDGDNEYSGFNIINCTIGGDNFERTNGSARVTSGINWQSIGTWPTYVHQTNTLTFGDAYISNIHIYPWDDTRIQIEFNIMAGLMTNIPAGAQIGFEVPYGNIWPNVVLFNGSNSYDYDEFYDNIIISMDGGWNPMGTKIMLTLNNILPVAPDPNNISAWNVIAHNQEAQQVYDRGHDFGNDERFATSQLTIYTNGNDRGMTQQNIIVNSKINNPSTKGTDNQNLNQHQTTNSNGPLVQNITGIMFNFVLSAISGGQTTTLYFAASGGLLSDKVYINANYNNGASKDVNIINGLLNYTPSVTDKEEFTTSNQETLDTLTYMYNQINEMQEIIQDLASGKNNEDGENEANSSHQQTNHSTDK